MDFISQARDLYAGPVVIGEICGWCDTCPAEIKAEDPVFVDRDTKSTPGGGTVTTCRMRCPSCESERRR